MRARNTPDQLVCILFRTIVVLVRRKEERDLNERQFGIFLACYLMGEAQTVRGLANLLDVSKPGISRGLDRLEKLGFVRRKIDPLDKRSVLTQRTRKGANFLRDLRNTMSIVARDVAEVAAARTRAPQPSRRKK